MSKTKTISEYGFNFQVKFIKLKSSLNVQERSEQKLINFPTFWSPVINNSKIEKWT